jgi:DNA-binding MarR family transcriptional regulator
MSDEAMIAKVRSFNRTVTQRVGALNDHFLDRDRPLGEARALWEIGPDGCDVRRLRSRLGLDSGYLSRLLRSLEAAGLITVSVDRLDKRVRHAQLTDAGRSERALLDRRSDALAWEMLEPLTEQQRARVVAAMREVEVLLTAALIEFAEVDPDHPHAQHCLREYFAELNRRFDTGFDLAASRLPNPEELRAPHGEFVVATLRGEPIGCGGLRFHRDQSAELKRMWLDPSARGLGVGRLLLAQLERRAAEHGCRVLRLDTNKSLTQAIAMYRSSGYTEVPAFNDERYADHWFEKRLA